MDEVTTIGLDLAKHVFQVQQTARIAWTAMHRQENYQRMALAA